MRFSINGGSFVQVAKTSFQSTSASQKIVNVKMSIFAKIIPMAASNELSGSAAFAYIPWPDDDLTDDIN